MSASSLLTNGVAPFDHPRLDELMEKRGLDVLVATSRHNVQYLLGGFRFFFFEFVEAIGTSRYLPIVVYPKGRPQDALYVGNAAEKSSRDRGLIWTPYCTTTAWGSMDAISDAITHLKALGRPVRRIGIESAFLSVDARDALAIEFGHAEFIDAHRVLERLRSVKTAKELALVKQASKGVVRAMLATFAASHIGQTKHQIVATLRREEQDRGIDFNFCQTAVGASFDRAPSDQVLQANDVVSLDSGGSAKGYIGDLCRMGVAGEPDTELQDILAQIDSVQQAARRAIRTGRAGAELIAAGDAAVATSPDRAVTDFTVHGVGLVNHEAPRLAHGRPLPYAADDAETLLEAGMVLSVETTVHHPRRGFIKLEDTLVVTSDGSEALADDGRGWNIVGAPDEAHGTRPSA